MSDEQNNEIETEEEGTEQEEGAVSEGSVLFMVYSMVRRQKTRTKRATAPTKHRFKQYLFFDPNRRLIRNRPLKITGEELDKNIEYLRNMNEQGILEVRSLDGRVLDLTTKELSPSLATSSPEPNFPLDSVERDKPAGIPMANLPGGLAFNDPVAQRTAQQLAESHRQDEAESTEGQAAEPPHPPPSVDPTFEGTTETPATISESESSEPTEGDSEEAWQDPATAPAAGESSHHHSKKKKGKKS